MDQNLGIMDQFWVPNKFLKFMDLSAKNGTKNGDQEPGIPNWFFLIKSIGYNMQRGFPFICKIGTASHNSSKTPPK